MGLLGGAFDPPHVGHVALARAAIDELGLERLLVLVVASPGHKGVFAPAEARLELARLAFEDVPEATVELDPYARTVDSLEERRLPDAYFVLGADELADFWAWKEPDRVLELVRLAVAKRPGIPERELAHALARFPEDRVVVFDMPATPVSSTEVRARVARGESIAELVPEKVEWALGRLGLYADAE
jgi:nicotinate-nucleotide adenylyltransferase